MAEILYRLNLSYTRLTYIIEKPDKNKQEKFKYEYHEILVILRKYLAK